MHANTRYQVPDSQTEGFEDKTANPPNDITNCTEGMESQIVDTMQV